MKYLGGDREEETMIRICCMKKRIRKKEEFSDSPNAWLVS